ncbi:MAG: hypothetical protein KY476_15480 [Planctomycetes bacterium]|nr:hypothetical protein [Planctomycetota bacterium]
MYSLKRAAEWYLGVPPVEAGQGTQWNFAWRWPLPPWLMLIVAAAAVLFVLWVYFRDARAVRLRTRLVLAGLRLAAIALVLFFLAELKLSVDRTGLPTIVVLIDDSESMKLADQYSGAAAQERLRELLAEARLKDATRLNLAKAVLVGDGGDFLKRLARRHKLRVYHFSETASPLIVDGREVFLEPADIERLLPALRKLEPTGPQTRPGPAVRKVLDDLRGAPPSAIVILTDGVASTGEADRLSEAAAAAYSKLVPIFAVGTGSDEPARDLHLYGVLSERIAFVGDPLTFYYNLRSSGFAGRSLNILLKEERSGEILKRETIPAGPNGQTQKLELEYTPPEKGEFDYVVEVEPLPGETDAENNVSRPQHVVVRQEPIRVLLADNVPRYEFRYLKHLLEREALREGDSTLELDIVLQDADLEYAAEDRTALEHFPVKRDDLFRYDVIIFGDLDPDFLTGSVLELLRDFVRDRGGGLIMVAGPLHNPHSYRGTPLEVMLPVELSTVRTPPPDEPIEIGFRPELTLEGRKESSIFRFERSEEASVQAWDRLPELYWFVEAPEVKRGAFVFAQHPQKRGADGKLPIISMQRYGAGKVLFHSTDELWRWRFRRGDLYYGRYWIQAIRYLTRSRLLGRDKGATLAADKEFYQRGDTVRLRLRFLDERLIPVEKDGVTVMIERRGGAQQTVALSQLPHAPAVFEGQLSRAGEGSYHALVVKPAFSEAPPSEDFLVESKSRELLETSLDRADLVRTAQTTHGRFYTIGDAMRLPDDIPPGQPVPLESRDPIPLWNRWELLLVFAGLLLAEWLLRKRCRLV